MRIERTIETGAPLPAVFAYLTDVRNHPRLTPPETRERVVAGGSEPLRLGSEVTFRARYGWRFWTLTSRITVFEPPDRAHPGRARFRDEQVRGPFARWTHAHLFRSTGEAATRVTDRFDYVPPLGPLGWVADRLWLRRRLETALEHMQGTARRLIEGQRSSG